MRGSGEQPAPDRPLHRRSCRVAVHGKPAGKLASHILPDHAAANGRIELAEGLPRSARNERQQDKNADVDENPY